MPTVGSLAWALIADNTRFATGTAAARRDLRGLRMELVSLRGALTSFAGPAGFAAVTAGVTGLAAGAAAFVKEGVRMTATLEQLRVNMDVMTGSPETGGALLGQMVTLAKETPFSLEGVATAGKVLLAMGVSAGDVTKTLKMLGDVAAGTSQPVDQLAQVFGEVQQAGRLTSNELRQFNMRGIPLLSELSDMLGVSKSELREMITASEITADMVTEAFRRMSSEGGRFADLMGKQADTLTGKWERFKDALSLAAAQAMGDPGTSGTAAHFLGSLLDEGGKALGGVSQGASILQSEGLAAFTQEGQQRWLSRMIAERAAAGRALQAAEGNASDQEVDEAQEALNEKMQEFVEKLQLQVDTYGMASDAAKLYEMQLQGATQADIEAAQALIDHKNKLDEEKKAREIVAEREEKEAAALSRLGDSAKGQAAKFGDEFGDILKIGLTKAGQDNPEVIQSALADLRDRIQAELPKTEFATAQSTAAIRAGSVDALRAQFSGRSTSEKQLKEAEKQTREQESMRSLLQSIEGKITGLAEAPG